MRKIISVILCLSIILCFAACSEQGEGAISYKTFEIDRYKIDLPETYKLNDLEKVNAEPNCIAMLSDKNGQLPDLWIYVDPFEGKALKEFVFTEDAKWDFDELAVYKKDGHSLARTSFDEVWYGKLLINEVYYKIKGENKVLWFDFAYDDKDDVDAMHSYVEEIAGELGF